MPLSFKEVNDPPLVETVYEDDASFVDSVPDGDFLEAETKASVSCYKGDIKHARSRMFFGSKEFLGVFALASDKGAFDRVWKGDQRVQEEPCVV
jgi:hypothetical protein